MGSQLSLPIRAAQEIAARGASRVRRGIAGAGARILNGVVRCALIAIFALRLAAAGAARLVAERSAIALLAFAAGIPLGALGYQAQHAWRAPDIGFAAGKGDDGTGEFAGFNRWKRGVEQALKEAEVGEQARRQNEATAEVAREPTATAELRAVEEAPPRIDTGIAQEAARLQRGTKPQAEASNEKDEIRAASETREAYGGSATEEANAASPTSGTSEPAPFSNSPVTEDRETVPPGLMEAPAGAMTVPAGPTRFGAGQPELDERSPWRHLRGHGGGRGHWRGGHHRWAYIRLTGVGRAFPFILSVR